MNTAKASSPLRRKVNGPTVWVKIGTVTMK